MISKLKTNHTIRADAALKMGLIQTLSEAQTRAHTPKIAWVAPSAAYTAAGGKTMIEIGRASCRERV